jgi:hypothetical protein
MKFCPVDKFMVCGKKGEHCPISSKFDMWVDNDVLN